MDRYLELSSVHELLEDAARSDPTAVAVTFVDGRTHTRADLLAQVRTVASGLQRAGVGPGDRVALLIGNRVEFLHTYFALSAIGAVSVPLNTALRGDVLTYMLDTVSPCHLIGEADLITEAAPAIRAARGLGTIWAIPTRSGDLPEVARRYDTLTTEPPVEHLHPGTHSDLVSILYTSGTTGRSKGVMWSQRMALGCARTAQWVMGFEEDDVVYTCLPLFHINALYTAVVPALQAGIPIVISPRFSASRFWEEIGEHRATVTNMLGAMGAVLWKQEPHPREQAHRLRLAMIVPLPTPDQRAVERRWGCQVTQLYGSTDTSIPVGVPHGEHRPGSCGRVAPGWEIRVVDAMDEKVPAGVAGELITRPSLPYLGQLGYWNDPGKTWEAHRNAWFHTGDSLVQDEDGWLYFKDRLKDAMRVSGENVSSLEVELVLGSHPAVAEVAVFAVPSELGEDDIMACVVPEPGQSITAEELVDFGAPRLAHFAVPRYVDVVDGLPKTTTQKVQKGELRTRGVTDSTWDRGPRRPAPGAPTRRSPD